MNKITLPEKFQLTDEENKALLSDEDGKKKNNTLKNYWVAFRGKKDEQTLEKKNISDDAQAGYTIMNVLMSKKLMLFAVIMMYIW